MYDKVKRFTKDQSVYKTTCKNHYQYILNLNTKDFMKILRYIQGKLMIFSQLKNKNSNIELILGKKEIEYRKELIVSLNKIIKVSPPTKRAFKIYRAHLFNIEPKTGEQISFKRPTSFTMWNPFTVEWLTEHLEDEKKLLKYIIVLDIPKGYDNVLCVGSISPLVEPNSKFLNLEDKFISLWNTYYQGQISTQHEIILGSANIVVKRINEFKLSNINNFNKYGHGWFSSIHNKTLISNNTVLKVIHCSLVV